MKFTVLGIIAFLFAATIFAAPTTMETVTKQHPIGLGVMLGAPSAVTGQYWFSPKNSVAAGIAGYFNYVMGYGDYLYHFPQAFKNPEFSPYVGPGVFISNWLGGASIGARVTMGAQWFPKKLPVGFFLEIAPGITVIPLAFLHFSGGVGARYFF